MQGTLCFPKQAKVAQKSWMIKSIFNTVKNLRARTSCSKILNVEKIFNTLHKRFEMYVKDAIGTEENLTLQANWRQTRSRYKRIQLHRTDLQDVSGPIRIKNKKSYFQRKLFIFRANCYFQGKFFPLSTLKCLPVRVWLGYWFLLCRDRSVYILIKTGLVTSLRHQRGWRGLWERPKCFIYIQ